MNRKVLLMKSRGYMLFLLVAWVEGYIPVSVSTQTRDGEWKAKWDCHEGVN